jgi:hypothetical protein
MKQVEPVDAEGENTAAKPGMFVFLRKKSSAIDCTWSERKSQEASERVGFAFEFQEKIDKKTKY